MKHDVPYLTTTKKVTQALYIKILYR